MTINLTFHGAAKTVTGSCIHVKTKNTQLLIDCGVVQESGFSCRSDDFPFDPSQLDAVILTHGHLDHSGNLPLLVKNGFKGKIYGHYATCVIANVIWKDSLAHTENGGPQFCDSDVADTNNQCMSIAYSVPMQIKDVAFTLYDAGHILGSSHVLLEADGKKILFSGDIGPVNTPIIRDPHCKWSVPVDAVVIESTYGNRIHKNRDTTILEFESIVKKTIESRGVLLVPAFAIGRTQEILYHLNTFSEEKRIPLLPVFVDSPMATKITGIYRKNRDCYDDETHAKIMSGDLPLEFKGLFFVETPSQSEGIRATRPPFVIIAGSGMCNGGRILDHLAHFITQETTTVMFAGWQGSGTMGRNLVEGAKTITIKGKQYPVKAAIATLNGFSAHADQRGLLNWAKAIPGKPGQWFVNHGEAVQAEVLAHAITIETGGKAIVADLGVGYNV